MPPPSYTGLDGELQRSGDIKALLGSEIKLRIWANREVKSGEILFEDGTSLPLKTGAEEDLIGDFVVSKDSAYRLGLVDEDGYANEPAQYRIVSLPDNVPSVRLLSPEGDLAVSENDTINLSVEAEDDYGLAVMELHYQIEDKVEITQVIKTYRSYRRSVSETMPWELEPLDLSPGDVVSYYIVIWDTDTVSGPKSARTRVYQLTLPTIGESLGVVQDDQQKQLRALGEIARSQGENRDETAEILNRLENMQRGEELDWLEDKKLEGILERQESIREEALKLAEAIRETLENIEREELRRALEEENLSSFPLEQPQEGLQANQETDELAKRPEGESDQLQSPPSEEALSEEASSDEEASFDEETTSSNEVEEGEDSSESPQNNSDESDRSPQEDLGLPSPNGENPQESQNDPQENGDSQENDPMSSPQIAEKMEEVREMLERLSTREMQETIRRLMEANRENNLDQLRNQLEIAEMSQEEFLQAMEQLLSLLERAYEEQKMLDLVNFARRMLREERSIRLTTRFFSGYDELPPEVKEEVVRLADRQERLAREDLEEFKAAMGEMQDPPLKEALDKLAKWMEEQELQGNMEEASKNLREDNLDNALSLEGEVEEDLALLTDALEGIYNDMVSSDLDRLLAMLEMTIRRSLYLSTTQEDIFLRLRDLAKLPLGRSGRERGIEMGELAERELELKPQLSLLQQEINGLVQGTPQVGMDNSSNTSKVKTLLLTPLQET